MTQGDKPRFLAQVHHVGVTGQVALRLAVYAGEREEVYPRTIDVKGDGVEEVLFEPFEVPDGDTVRLTLTAELGEAKDELVIEVPIRPWGVQAFASASGTASDDATVFVGLPAGRTYESPEMLDRRLADAPADADRAGPGTGLRDLAGRWRRAPCAADASSRPSPNTTADRASDLLAATSALAYLANRPDGGRARGRSG